MGIIQPNMKVGGRACTPLLHEQVAQEEMCLHCKKTSVSHQGIPSARAEEAGQNYQSDGKLTFFRQPECLFLGQLVDFF